MSFFASRDNALELTLADLYPLLRQSLDWFQSLREMSMEVRSSKLDIGFSSSDKAVEADTMVSTPSSLNPSSS